MSSVLFARIESLFERYYFYITVLWVFEFAWHWFWQLYKLYFCIHLNSLVEASVGTWKLNMYFSLLKFEVLLKKLLWLNWSNFLGTVCNNKYKFKVLGTSLYGTQTGLKMTNQLVSNVRKQTPVLQYWFLEGPPC